MHLALHRSAQSRKRKKDYEEEPNEEAKISKGKVLVKEVKAASKILLEAVEPPPPPPSFVLGLSRTHDLLSLFHHAVFRSD